MRKNINLIGTLASNAEAVKSDLLKREYQVNVCNIMDVNTEELEGSKILLFAGTDYSMDVLLESDKIADKMAENILQAEPAKVDELKTKADMVICVDYLDTEEVADMIESFMVEPEDIDFAHTADKQRMRKRRKANFRVKSANARIKEYRGCPKTEELKNISNRKTRRVLKKEILAYNFDDTEGEAGAKTSSRNNIAKKCIRGYLD